MAGLCAPLPTLHPPALADDGARLRADVDRYSFIAVDLHHLLFAGLPAHTHPTRLKNYALVIEAARSPDE